MLTEQLLLRFSFPWRSPNRTEMAWPVRAAHACMSSSMGGSAKCLFRLDYEPGQSSQEALLRS